MPRLPRTGDTLSARHFSEVIRVAERGRVGSAPGTLTNSGPQGTSVKAQGGRAMLPGSAAITRHPWQVFVKKVEGVWKARVWPGTLDGLTPVVGDIEGTGGDPLTDSPPPLLTLTTGENIVALAIKVDLETHIILRSTIETREDSDLADIIDTGERTRIFFDIIAELHEADDDSWTLLTQTRRNHLTYDYGRLYCAAT